MTQPNILNNVKYRLQNVDFGTFLERRDRSTLIFRPLKEKSKYQQWLFVQPNSTQKVFEIQNVDDSAFVLTGKYSSSTSSLTFAKGANVKTGKKWKFYYASRENDNLFMVSDDINDEQNVLSFAQNNATGTLEYDPNLPTDWDKVNKSEAYQWKLVEVTPASLPDGDDEGKYRISTLNGLFVHSHAGDKKLHFENQGGGDNRSWEIKDLGNGRCTLRNVGEKKFLGVEKDRVNDRWVPVLTDSTTGLEWTIEVTSDFTWSICLWRDVTRNGRPSRDLLSLSVSGDTVILKPWKSSHNQIWLLEPTDAPINNSNNGGGGGEGGGGGGEGGGGGGNDGGGGGNGGGGGGNNAPILPNTNLISGRDYRLFNNNGTFGIVVELKGAVGSYRFLVTKKGGNPSPHDLTVDRRPNGQPGEVVIYYEFQGKVYYLTLNNNAVVGKIDSPYYWIIEQDPSSKLFFIRDSKSQLVVSASATQDSSLFVQNKVALATALWSFESS